MDEAQNLAKLCTQALFAKGAVDLLGSIPL